MHPLQKANSRDLEHLASVVGAIFSLSRQAERGVTLQLSEVPVRELLEEVYELVAPFAAEGDVALVLDCEYAPTVVRGERTALLWALMNLACFVLKSTPSGGEVRLSAAVLLHSVELRVTHTGAESPFAMPPSLFEPVEHTYTTDEVDVARDLTRLMGGQLLFRDATGTAALYAMRFHALRCPPRRLTRSSMARVA